MAKGVKKADVELFSYLGYDGSKTKEILTGLKLQTAARVPVEYLNKRLEDNIGVEWYDENLKPVDDSDKAKYMILDTGMYCKNKPDQTACVEIIKSGLTWSNGWVATKEELLESNGKFEAARAEKFNKHDEICKAVREAHENGGDSEEAAKAVKKVKHGYVISKQNKEIEKIAERIMERISKTSEEYDKDSVLILLAHTIEVYMDMVAFGTGEYPVHVIDDKAVINTGFIDDRGLPICLAIEYKYDGTEKSTLRVVNIEIVDNPKATFGFDMRPALKDITGDAGWGPKNIETYDRSRIEHCMNERRHRITDDAKNMSFNELWDRLVLSIDLCKRLEDSGVKMFEYQYSLSDHCFSWVCPFYLSSTPDLSKPDSLIVLRKDVNGWGIGTILDIPTGLSNVLTIDKYPTGLWTKNRKASEILEANPYGIKGNE